MGRGDDGRTTLQARTSSIKPPLRLHVPREIHVPGTADLGFTFTRLQGNACQASLSGLHLRRQHQNNSFRRREQSNRTTKGSADAYTLGKPRLRGHSTDSIRGRGILSWSLGTAILHDIVEYRRLQHITFNPRRPVSSSQVLANPTQGSVDDHFGCDLAKHLA